MRSQVMFQRADTGFGVVKNRRGQRGVGLACGEYVDEVLKTAGTARRNDGNGYSVRDGGRELAVESDLGTIAIDRRQQNFAGPAGFGFLRPLDGVTVSQTLAASYADRK